MLLSNILHERVIKIDIRSIRKAQAVEELLDLLIEAGELPMGLRNHAIQTIAEREKIIGTGLDFGVALPHGSTDRINSIIAALGISHEGVDFESRDGQPAKIIVLMLIPRKSFQEHLRAMAATARVMRLEEVREAILRAETAGEVLNIIEQAESAEDK
jgi:mannitol/fructose-specific phosphotransferase system IIA component (Ntr-type)